MKISFAVFVLHLLVVATVVAQQSSPLVITRLSGPIRLDGVSFEPAWEEVEPLPLVQYEPNPGTPPSEPTEIRVAYDSEYLYLSLRAYDSDLSGIRANTLYRDRLAGDDHFEILLDTYNDNETGVVFTTTPAGIRREAAIANDASGGTIGSGWLNVSYNTYWDVETIVNERGWFAEMRIPFSSLRFQDENGRVVMGLSVQRKIARRVERLIYPPVPRSIEWGFLKPSLARKIVMEGIYSHNPLYITPYGLSGVSHSTGWDDVLEGNARDNDWKREVGVDLKYGLTNNLTLDLTVNTDFAQVEADDQQINLTRFPLFYPEKRQFFQERAGLFDFRMGGQDRLFNSRRIGLTDDGLPVRLLGGARVVGRIGDWDVGFIDMQTADSRALPSENFGVLRLRRRVFNDYSAAGGMVTSRIGVDGSYSTAYGLDGTIRLFGDDYITVQWAQTFDDEGIDTGRLDLLNSGRLNMLMERRRMEGFGYESLFTWSGPLHNPGIGFIQRHDYTRVNQRVSYSWLPGASSSILMHSLLFEGGLFLRNRDRAVESLEIGPRYEFRRRSGISGDLRFKVSYEDLLFPFFPSGKTIVPAGNYTFFTVGGGYRGPVEWRRRLGVDMSAGTFFDGWQASLGLSPMWSVSPRLELSGEYVYNRVRFPDRDEGFDAHIGRLRIGTALNTELSTNAFLQYNSASRSFSANIRFRYNFREGNDLWIVFNESDWVDMTPILPTVDNRTLLIKYTYTFIQ